MKMTSSKYINYEGKILIIENSSLGISYKLQWNGTDCKQFQGRGYILHTFENDVKWFNSDYWYSLCSWFLDENLLYFGKDNPVSKNLFFYSDEKIKEIRKTMKLKTIDAKVVLDEILNITSTEVKRKIVPNFFDYQYGKNWGEAFIPIKVNNKKAILTWKNCD